MGRDLRGSTKTIELGAVDENTGLKSIFANGREWWWGGARYEPHLYGRYIKSRKPTEEELKLAVDWMKAHGSQVAGLGDAPHIIVQDANLRDGNEAFLGIQDLYFCGNDACPLLVLSGTKILHEFWSIGPDAGISDGRRDENGYRLIEIATNDDVSVVSPSTGAVVEHIRPQEVIVAGTPREAAQ